MLVDSFNLHFLALVPNHVQIVLFIELNGNSIGIVKHSHLIHFELKFPFSWPFNLFGSNLIENGTLEALSCGNPLMGIHFDQTEQQFLEAWIVIVQHFLEMVRAVDQVLLRLLEKLETRSGLDEGEVSLRPEHLQDGRELILDTLWRSIVSRGKWIAIPTSEKRFDLLRLSPSFLLHSERHQLIEDASDRPHVSTFSVLFLNENYLRRPEPSGADVAGHAPFPLVLVVWYGPCESKVTELDLAPPVDQNISRLDIPVDDVG